jgi:hypothetical protein
MAGEKHWKIVLFRSVLVFADMCFCEIYTSSETEKIATGNVCDRNLRFDSFEQNVRAQINLLMYADKEFVGTQILKAYT